MYPQLPTELWISIFNLLSPQDHQACLHVCRLYHDIALHYVFSTTNVYFGVWENGVWQYHDGGYETLLSMELLRRIIQDPEFASLVKKVVVHSYAANDATSMDLLVQALQAAPFLNSFHWLGAFELSGAGALIEVLSASCPSLQDLRIPSYFPLSVPVQGLNHLSFRWFQGVDFHPIFPNFHHMSMLGGIETIETNASTLQALALSFDQFSRLSFDNFTSLRSLDLSWIQHSNETDQHEVLCSFLRTTPRIESLAIEGSNLSRALLALGEHTSALPLLSSFKLVSTALQHTDAEYIVLLAFLEGRRGLRRLDINLSGEWRHVSTLLPSIRQMESLEALGLDLGYNVQTEDDYALLAGNIPASVTSLRLYTWWRSLPQSPDIMQPLCLRLAQLPYLSFLYISRGSNPKALVPEKLAASLTNLAILGLDTYFWDIDRSKADIQLSRWSDRKVVRRSMEDLRSESSEWLMRYHRSRYYE